ncbi:thermonuclease family protein [Paenibacillus swuensis]|nr:thermonuclease family protein [Paenibacillus swuensis]
MKIILRWMVLLPLASLVVSGCGVPVSGPPAEVTEILAAYPELEGHEYSIEQVKRMVDGDTLETDSGHKVRLIGVNTPETVKPNSPIETYGKEASAFSKKRLTGKTVVLFEDTGNTDRYGRWLRYLFVQGDPRMFNEELVREGYANTMTIPPNVMYSARFLKAEREARTNHKGLWAEAGANASESMKEANQAESSACGGPVIKGNINAEGEQIYHVAEGRYYKQTKAERLFCTESEAKAAGFRKSKS